MADRLVEPGDGGCGHCPGRRIRPGCQAAGPQGAALVTVEDGVVSGRDRHHHHRHRLGTRLLRRLGLSIHVIQHLLLMNVAPIFLVLGAPVTLALQASGRRTQTTILRVLHHPIVEVITNPLVVLFFFSVTMIAYFLTPFYQFSLEHPLVHDLTHLHFLITGCLYWWLVVGVDPSRWRLTPPMKLGFLAVDIPVGTLLGLGLTQASVSVAPSFHTLADTQQGGGLLWIASELFTFAAIGIVVFQWMRSDTREAARGDRRADADYAARWAGQSVDPDVARVGADLELTEVEVVGGRFVNVSHPGPVAGDR